MNIGVVTAICKAQGMSSVCLASGCVFNSPGCRVTPLSTNCNVPLVGLAQTLCADRWMGTGRWRPWYCPSVDGIFTDHLSTLQYGTKGQGACGYNYEANRGCRYKCCLSGDDYVSSETKPFYAYCVLQKGTNTNRNKTRVGYVQLGGDFGFEIMIGSYFYPI